MKHKFNLLALFIALLCMIDITAQVTPGLKKFVPPSPNASALGKYGEIPVGLYTGIPNISIPLYTLKGRELELPVNLSYHAGGIKVEEIASWVGIGWSLNAGGVITRVTRGLPDDAPPGYFNTRNTIVPLAKKYLTNLNPTTSYLTSAGNAVQADVPMLEQIKGQITDAEPDIFYFNFGKYSGKFFMNENGQFSVSPVQPMKIEYEYNSAVNTNQIARWTVTTPGGVKYIFGNSLDGLKVAIEKNNNAAQIQTTTTGWYLLEMYSPDNDLITLSYSTISYSYSNKSAETINQILDEGGTSPPAHLPRLDKSIVLNAMTVPKLQSITSAKGKITFSSLAGRTDLPGDNSLSSMSIFSNADLIHAQRTFVFNYDYANGGRLTLQSLEEFPASNISVGNKYKFEYNIVQLPDPDPDGIAINSQDLWGYYNGSPNDVLPQSFNISMGPPYGNILIDGADRHSSEYFMAAGVLTKITYPTGGYSLFDYEANKVYASNNSNIPPPAEGKTANLQYLTGQTNSATFDVHYASVVGDPTGKTLVTIVARAMTATPGCAVSPANGLSTCYTASIEGINGTSFTKQYIKDGTSTVYLANGSYKIEGKGELVPGYPNASYNFYLSLNWTEYPPEGGGGPLTMTNKTMGGLRIKRITNNDNSTTSIKKYLYNRFDDIGVSSAVLVNDPYHYANIFQIASGCGFTNYAQVRSYPLIPLLQTQGAPVGYENVTELDGENGENGKTEFVYTTASDYPDEIKDYRPYPSPGTYDWRRGQLLNSTIYKKLGGSFIPVKSTSNKYSFNNNSSTGYGLSVETGREIFLCGNPIIQAASEYYVLGYKTFSEFFYLQSDTTRLFDQNTPSNYVETINTYNYDLTKGHYQLIKQQTKNSKGEILTTNLKYPLDYTITGTATNNTALGIKNLQSKYIINPVIEAYTQKSNADGSNVKTLSSVFTSYKPTTPYPDIINKTEITQPLTNFIPATITASATSTDSRYKPQVQFDTYDASGNILQQHKIDDEIHSYIWDYNNTMPIAEVTNASLSDIAYTSFESTGKGNWSFTGTPITDYNPATGDKSYDLSSGPITKGSLTSATTYAVTFWSRSGPQTVNSITPSVTGLNVNGWVFYKYKLSNATTVTISGSGIIDELRLYPNADVHMTTYTYDPIIGMTSQCSANNDIVYYEYDGLGRLKLIKDQNAKILKKYCYNYAGQVEACSVPAATVTPNSVNSGVGSGFTATYTNVNNGSITIYNVSGTTNTVTNPTNLIWVSGPNPLPAGFYNLKLQKPGNVSTNYTYWSGCGSMSTDGITATFYNIAVSLSNCKTISISNLQ